MIAVMWKIIAIRTPLLLAFLPLRNGCYVLVTFSNSSRDLPNRTSHWAKSISGFRKNSILISSWFVLDFERLLRVTVVLFVSSGTVNLRIMQWKFNVKYMPGLNTAPARKTFNRAKNSSCSLRVIQLVTAALHSIMSSWLTWNCSRRPIRCQASDFSSTGRCRLNFAMNQFRLNCH